MDVSDPKLYQTQAHHELFRRLRQEDPVHYCTESPHGPYWVITRYHDIVAVDRNHEQLSSAVEHGGIFVKDSKPGAEANFITMDEPRHVRVRSMFTPAFTSESLARLEGEIRQRVDAILERVPVGETFDWVSGVANELPMQMLATLFGVPQEDRFELFRWSNEIIAKLSGVAFPERPGARSFNEYFFDLWQRRRAEPGNDLVSMLVHGSASQDMTPGEYISNLHLLIVGGNDTTRTSLTGGLVGMLAHPDQLEKLRAEPELLASAIDEIIRWVTPVIHMRRTALEDVELAGKLIRKGDKVTMWYVSGNRDETVFDEPDRLIIDRDGPRHLAFGTGVHHCIGFRLAKMQLRCMWEALLERFSRIEAMGEPERIEGNVVQGFTAFPVRLSA